MPTTKDEVASPQVCVLSCHPISREVCSWDANFSIRGVPRRNNWYAIPHSQLQDLWRLVAHDANRPHSHCRGVRVNRAITELRLWHVILQQKTHASEHYYRYQQMRHTFQLLRPM